MFLCHACTSMPIHAMARAGCDPSNARSLTAAEKLLADTCSVHSRQFTRLNFASLVNLVSSNGDDDVDDSAPCWNRDVDACLNRNFVECRSWFFRTCCLTLFKFNLSSNNAVFLLWKHNFNTNMESKSWDCLQTCNITYLIQSVCRKNSQNSFYTA